MIQRGVLSFTERHVVRLLYDLSAVLLRMLEVSVKIFHGHVDISSEFVAMRRAKGPALTTKHDGTLGDVKLRMPRHSIKFDAESLGKTERSTQPVDRLTDVLVDQDRHDSRGRRRAVFLNSCFHLHSSSFRRA